MNEFEKQMLAMMQTMQADMTEMKGEITGMKGEITGMKGEITGIKGEIAEMKADIQRLDQKIDAGFEELREADAIIAEGLTKITDTIGEAQRATAEKVNAIEAVVSGLVFDVAVLKRKVG